MRNRILKAFILFGLITSTTFSLLACNPASTISKLEGEFVDDQEAHKNPLFWDDTTKVSDATNLSVLTPDCLNNKPYSEAARLGDQILMIGRAWYSNDNRDTSDPEYSFDLYSPWSNSIRASLNHTEISCDGYQVLNNKYLLLYSSSKNLLWLYDDTLHLLGTYHIKGLSKKYELKFYANKDCSSIYTCNTQSDSFALYSIKLSTDPKPTTQQEIEPKELDKTGLDQILTPTVGGLTTDKKALYLYGVDHTTLRNCVFTYDLSEEKVLTSVAGNSFYLGKADASDYLVCDSDYNKAFTLHRDDKDSYFYLDNDASLDLRLKKSFITSNYGTDPSSFHAAMYQYDGTYQSSFRYNLEEQKTAFHLANTPVVFGGDKLCFYLLYSESSAPRLLVWDYSKKGKNTDSLAIYEDRVKAQYEYSLTQQKDNPLGVALFSHYPDSSYDWGDLKECRTLANTLEQKYHVEIYLGEVLPDKIDVFDIEKMTDKDTIMETLTALDTILGSYPNNFFEQLIFNTSNNIKIYLAGKLTSSDSASVSAAGAFVCQIDESKIMVVDCNEYASFHNTLHHEISHMIDARLEYRSNLIYQKSYFSTEGWDKLNPSAFQYTYSYVDYAQNKDYYNYTKYFISPYSTTFPTEDRAEIFGAACEYASNEDADWIKENYFTKQVTAKLDYYAKSIRDGFDTTGWPDTLLWEKILKELS